jgi:hypothetical protein
MYLEINDVKVHSNKLVFRLEYDEEFRLEVGRIKKIISPSKKDVQNYILEVIEKEVDFDSLTEPGD